MISLEILNTRLTFVLSKRHDDKPEGKIRRAKVTTERQHQLPRQPRLYNRQEISWQYDLLDKPTTLLQLFHYNQQVQVQKETENEIYDESESCPLRNHVKMSLCLPVNDLEAPPVLDH